MFGTCREPPEGSFCQALTNSFSLKAELKSHNYHLNCLKNFSITLQLSHFQKRKNSVASQKNTLFTSLLFQQSVTHSICMNALQPRGRNKSNVNFAQQEEENSCLPSCRLFKPHADQSRSRQAGMISFCGIEKYLIQPIKQKSTKMPAQLKHRDFS